MSKKIGPAKSAPKSPKIPPSKSPARSPTAWNVHQPGGAGGVKSTAVPRLGNQGWT